MESIETISEKCLVKIYTCEHCKEDCQHEDARSLPCSHTFCLKCIAGLTVLTQTGATTPCHLCNEVFILPAGGEVNFPEARSTGQTKYIVKAPAAAPNSESCDACSAGDHSSMDDNGPTKVPTVYCLYCHKRLCTACNMQHAEQHASHTTVDLAEVPDANLIYAQWSLTTGPICGYYSLPPCCDKHATQRIDSYCTVCRTLICRDCRSDRELHNNHIFSYIVEAGSRYRRCLRQNARVFRELANAADQRLAGFAARDAAFCRKLSLVSSEVQQHAQKLTAKITEKIAREERKLLSELDDFEGSRLTRRDTAFEVLSQYTESELKTMAERSDLMSRTLLLDDMARRDEIKTLNDEVLDNWKQLEDVNVRFIASDLSFDYNGTDLGKLIAEDVAENSLFTFPVLAKVVDGVDNQGILAMALLDNQLFVTRRNVSEVTVYDASTLQFQRGLTHSGFGNFLPGLAVRPGTKCLYVSDFNNNCVHKVGLSAQLPIISVCSEVKNPIGLSFHPAGEMLVANDGFVRKCDVRPPKQGPTTYCCDPYHVVAASDALCAFSSVEGSGLFLTTGNRIRMVNMCGNDGMPGSESTKKLLRGLVVTREFRFLFAADHSNSRIIVVQPRTGKARHLPLDVDVDLQSPCALCYDESRGRLYVGEDGGQNRVLAFDRVVNLDALFTKERHT